MESEFLQKVHNMSSGVTKIVDVQDASIFGASAGYLTVTLIILTAFQFLLKRFHNGKYFKNEDAVDALDVIPGPKPFFIKFIGCAFDFLPLSGKTYNERCCIFVFRCINIMIIIVFLF